MARYYESESNESNFSMEPEHKSNRPEETANPRRETFKVDLGFAATVDSATASHLESEIRQILDHLGLTERLTIQTSR